MCPPGLHGFLLVVLACVLVSASGADHDFLYKRRPTRVDCVRYVYAPSCRGVSAKRSSIQITRINDVIPEPEAVDNAIEKSLSLLLRNHESSRTWQPLESLLFPSLQYELRPRDRKRRQASVGSGHQIPQDSVVSP
ncbi:hypothetical protein BsWGS_18925 [Bradybaena similaris]